jgi:pimeloyl-ACP methyl ester carboxylesterase
MMPPAEIVSTSRGTMACVTDGAGMPVLAIHGGMGGCDQSWILGRALFSDTARLHAVARPGYAGTPLTTGLTPEAQADAYAALLDQLRIDKILVAAISAGGLSALQFALRHPDRCRGVILVSTATGRLQTPPEMVARLATQALTARMPGAAGYLRRKVGTDPMAAASRSLPDAAEAAALLAHPEAGPLFRLFQQGIFTDLRARIAGTRHDIALLATLMPLPLAALRVPVLDLHAVDDPVVPVAHAEALCAQAPRAECVRLAKGGHVALFTEMDTIRSHVARFVGAL